MKYAAERGEEMIGQLLILILVLLVIPFVIGGLVTDADREGESLLFRWTGGQFLLWAGFQLICVPLILRERGFRSLVAAFWGYIVALLLLAAAVEIRRWPGERKFPLSCFRSWLRKIQFTDLLLWAAFWSVLLFQLVQAVRLAYADGDDAYYVAVSSITQDADTMYSKLAYTGGGTELDIRHGLAPFPIWISFLGRSSGMPAAIVAHVVLPVVLIAMTYGIFYQIGLKIFEKKDGRLPLFLLFTELLVLFGNYSIYTPENFMIARSRQGKAALGNIVIPFLLLLFLIFLKSLQEKRRIPPLLYLLFCAAATTGCLCSTLGALLVCMAVGIVGLLGSICYRRPGILAPLAVCCMPCVFYALMYLIL